MPDLKISEELKKQLLALLKDDENKAKHEHYLAAKEHFEEMSWHVYGKKPVRLLERMRPREDPAITKYRLESYEPITKSKCKKAISILTKVFNPKLYSIRFTDEKKKEEEILKKYTLEEYPRFNSIVNYFSSYILKKMIADPNGIILAQPYYYFFKEQDRVKPILTCYNSEKIHQITPEYALLFDKKVEGSKEKEWYYTYVDKIGIYKLRITQTNTESNQATVVTEASYIHNLGELPLWQLGGDYSEEQYGLLESFFYDAVPFWNEAINDHSDVNGNYRMHINSQKWEIADECEYVEHTDTGHFPCDGGYIFNSTDGKKFKCPSCMGSGYKKTATGPYDVYQIDRQKALEPEQVPLPPFGYVAPPVEGLKMLQDTVFKKLEEGLSAINMDIVNKIGENQSGISKEYDRSELNDFLQKIANQFFEIHLPNTYYYFVRYMFGVEIPNPEELKKIEPEISKPTKFDVWSTSELTTQLKDAKTAGLNPTYQKYKQIQVQSTEFQTHPELMKRVNDEILLDPLAEVAREDVSMMLANGTITKETAVIHDNISEFISRALEDDKKFLDQEPTKQKEVLKKYAQEVIEANKVALDTTMFDETVSPGA
jgi:hypothetical protein